MEARPNGSYMKGCEGVGVCEVCEVCEDVEECEDIGEAEGGFSGCRRCRLFLSLLLLSVEGRIVEKRIKLTTMRRCSTMLVLLGHVGVGIGDDEQRSYAAAERLRCSNSWR